MIHAHIEGESMQVEAGGPLDELMYELGAFTEVMFVKIVKSVPEEKRGELAFIFLNGLSNGFDDCLKDMGVTLPADMSERARAAWEAAKRSEAGNG